MFVVLVDAGFLMAGAATIVNGSPSRERIVCHHAALIKGLIKLGKESCDDDFLRLYWYDASQSGTVELDQVRIAELPGTKVRLGRLVRGEQKGVDSRIIADMMRLAWRKAASTFYLVSGDEDLVEAVEEVQAHGCRLILVSLPKISQSRYLMHAADEIAPLDIEVIKRSVTQIEPAGTDAHEAGAQFAITWMASVDPGIVHGLMSQDSTTIPQDIDTQLMRAADTHLGGILRGAPGLREAVRAGFWSALQQRAS